MTPVELAAGVIEPWLSMRPVVLPQSSMFPVRSGQPRVYLAPAGEDVVAVGFVSFFLRPRTWGTLVGADGLVKGQYQPGGWPVIRVDRAPLPDDYELLSEHFLLNDQTLEFWRVWIP